MAKLTAREVGLHLDEHNKLEYELSGDEHDREHWEEYQAEHSFDEWNRAEDWEEPFDQYDYGYDPWEHSVFDDLFDGEM